MDATFIYSATVAFQYGYAAGVGGYASEMAGKPAWEARQEATEVMNSTEVKMTLDMLDEGETKRQVKLVQDTAVETARMTFKYLGLNRDYEIEKKCK